ncbi:MAG TPA: D-alanyl-D-alanine carboxypeptidase family protein [Lichenihabitans sp.]|nr:D-alanyl-D-alanine carboxypeptidase family protein [Lichenihabitans sp.]
MLLGLANVGTSLAAVPTAVGEGGFQSIAPYALLIDADTGTVLFEKNADALMAPASTAKIMTAEVVFHEIKEGRLRLDDKFLVSEHAWRTGGAPSHGSAMFAVPNSRIAVEDLIKGLVIDSGNDAAIVLAEGIAGSEEQFAAMMNRRAREIGMTKSTFTNPWGRGDPGQKVTARDMAVLADYVITTYPALYRYFGQRDFTWDRVHQLNRNPLLTMNIGADGLKTGDLTQSGYGIVGSAVQKGERLILVLNGLRTGRDRSNESLKLLDWGFRSFEPKQLYAAGETVGAAKVYGGAESEVPLVTEKPVAMLVPRGNDERLTGKIVYKGPLSAPVEKGAKVAEIKIFRNGTEILSAPLRTAEAVPVGSLPHRAMDAGLEFLTTLIRQNFTRH